MNASARALSRFAAAAALALVASAAPALSATLKGAVKGDGHPLVLASVRILELDRAEQTGESGEFRFLDVPPGTYHVRATLIGFAPASQAVDVKDDGGEATFDLATSPIPVDEIVVTATPTPRSDHDLSQSASAKSKIQFLQTAGLSFADKLSDLPGVNVRGNGAAPARPVLRGLSDDRVLVLENGLRMGDIATYDPAHATPIEAVSIDEVDVVRGPAAVLYGPSTIGGVVNLLTDVVPTVSDRPFSGALVGEGNSVSDQYAGSFHGVWSGAHSAFGVTGGGVHAQDIKIPKGTYVDPASGAAFDLTRMPQSFQRSSEGGLGYAYQGDFGHIGVGGKHFETNYGIPGVPPNDDWEDVPPATSRIAQRRNTYELDGVFHAANSSTRQLKLKANFNDYNHSEFPTAEDSTGVSDPQANHFHKRAWNARLEWDARPKGKVESTLGLWTNIENLTIDGDQPLGPNSLTTGFAGYAFEEIHASPRTRLQAGLRYDVNHIQTRPNPTSTDSVFQISDESRHSNAVTASVGVVQALGTGLTGTLSLGRSFRAPTVQELFANGLDAPSGTYTIGTATLVPETGFGVDASLKGAWSKVTFDVSPYANYIKNYVYGFLRGDTLLAFPVRQFAATDARLLGFESGVTVQAARHVALRAQSDYVNAEDTRADVPLPFTPPLRGLLRATFQDTKHMAMAEWRLAARQTRLGDGDTETPGYGVVNVGVGLRVVSGASAHNVSLSCDNVFNRVYRDHLSVIKDFIPQPARGVRLNYELAF